jgi:hypothetical protein
VLAVSHFWGYRRWIFVAPAEEVRRSLEPGAVAAPLGGSAGPGAPPFRIALGAPASWVNFWKSDRAGWRAAYVRAGGVDVNLLHGVASIGGYSPLMPRHYARFAGAMQMWGGPTDPALFGSTALDLLNVRFVAVPAPPIGFGPGAFRDLEPVWEADGLRILRNPGALGLVWGVEGVAPAADAAERLRTARRGTIDVRRTALVAPEDGARLAGRRYALPTRLAARHLDANTVAVEVEAPGEAFLASSLVHYPGWRATIDGERAPLRRVNGLFYGLAVPAGRHRVLLRYRPASFAWGLALSALAAAALVAGTVLDRRRRRRPPSRSTSPPRPAPTAGSG